MFKEVLHHTYKLGMAIDTSGAGNDGVPLNVGFLGSGREPGTGAVQFNSTAARIHVDTRDWGQPLAVRIDAWVKVTPPATPRRLNIVEASRSFAFFIHPDNTLWGTFLGGTGPGSGLSWHGANTLSNAVGGGPVTVPVNTWTKLSYLHDGFGTLRLYIDDTLVAQNNIWAAVMPIQAEGLEIGHWVGDDRYTFSGEIDDVRISIYDKNAIVEEFYCRLDVQTGACWDRLAGELSGLLTDKETRKQTAEVLGCMQDAQRELVRAIVRAGPGSKKQLAELRQAWLKAWCSNDDPERAAEWMERFVRLFEQIMGRRAWCALLAKMNYCGQRLPMNERTRKLYAGLAQCDPWYAALIKAGSARQLHKRCDEPPPDCDDRGSRRGSATKEALR